MKESKEIGRKDESVRILNSFVHLLEMEVEFYNFPASWFQTPRCPICFCVHGTARSILTHVTGKGRRLCISWGLLDRGCRCFHINTER